MVKFKCVHTGNVYEFKSEGDIEVMRTHPEYEELQDEETSEEVTAKVGRKKKEQ